MDGRVRSKQVDPATIPGHSAVLAYAHLHELRPVRPQKPHGDRGTARLCAFRKQRLVSRAGARYAVRGLAQGARGAYARYAIPARPVAGMPPTGAYSKRRR